MTFHLSAIDVQVTPFSYVVKGFVCKELFKVMHWSLKDPLEGQKNYLEMWYLGCVRLVSAICAEVRKTSCDCNDTTKHQHSRLSDSDATSFSSSVNMFIFPPIFRFPLLKLQCLHPGMGHSLRLEDYPWQHLQNRLFFTFFLFNV